MRLAMAITDSTVASLAEVVSTKCNVYQACGTKTLLLSQHTLAMIDWWKQR